MPVIVATLPASQREMVLQLSREGTGGRRNARGVDPPEVLVDLKDESAEERPEGQHRAREGGPRVLFQHRTARLVRHLRRFHFTSSHRHRSSKNLDLELGNAHDDAEDETNRR